MLMPVLSAVCNYSSQDTNVIGYEIKQHGASTHMSGQGGLLVLGLVTGKQAANGQMSVFSDAWLPGNPGPLQGSLTSNSLASNLPVPNLYRIMLLAYTW